MLKGITASPCLFS